jgi:hypothetical protein
MATVQYWATQRLWIKGGIGFAKLLVSRSDDGVIPDAPKNGCARTARVVIAATSPQAEACQVIVFAPVEPRRERAALIAKLLLTTAPLTVYFSTSHDSPRGMYTGKLRGCT